MSDIIKLDQFNPTLYKKNVTSCFRTPIYFVLMKPKLVYGLLFMTQE